LRRLVGLDFFPRVTFVYFRSCTLLSFPGRVLIAGPSIGRIQVDWFLNRACLHPGNHVLQPFINSVPAEFFSFPFSSLFPSCSNPALKFEPFTKGSTVDGQVFGLDEPATTTLLSFLLRGFNRFGLKAPASISWQLSLVFSCPSF